MRALAGRLGAAGDRGFTLVTYFIYGREMVKQTLQGGDVLRTVLPGALCARRHRGDPAGSPAPGDLATTPRSRTS